MCLDEIYSEVCVGKYLSYLFPVLGIQFLAGAGNFSLQHSVQTGSVAHPASYPMCTRSSFPGR